MSVIIEGVRIENPTATWTQSMNTRRGLLDKKEKWNSGTWISTHLDMNGRAYDVTMCLSNAIRFVAYGKVQEPDDMGSLPEAEMPDAERLVLRAINLRHCPGVSIGRFTSIPAFNDAEGRTWEEVVQVLDDAIAMVGPYAKKVIMAAEVMTEEERDDIDAQIAKAERDIWNEHFSSWLTSHEERGWTTFWDELKGYCQGDPKCEERVLSLR